MLMEAIIVTLLGCLSIANADIQFCSGSLCFIKLDPYSGKTWMEAQQKCKENNSTLPIVDNPDHQMSFVDALNNFQLSGTDVWLGANASDYGSGNWRWLDGRQYTRTEVQDRGEYFKSYAYVAYISATVLAYASPPNISRSYMCQYNSTIPNVCTNNTGRTAFVKENRCYVKSDEKLSWFSARNNCLTNNGDLASFSQLSLLDGIIDSSGFWVGLRHSQWNWQNTVTGSSSDVTFTSWRIGQPDGAAPQCLAIDSGDFPNWKDFNCTSAYSYICQVFNTTNPPSTHGASSITPSSLSSTTTTKSGFQHDLGSVKVPLAIGLGVGLGVPFIILIVVIVVVTVRRKYGNSITNGNSQSRKRFVFSNRQKPPKKETTEMNETTPDRNFVQYATIGKANDFDPETKLVSPSNKGVVYADLQFGQERY